MKTNWGKVEKLYKMILEEGVSVAVVVAWSEAIDAIDVVMNAAGDEIEEQTPFEVLDANLDANLDDPEILRIQTEDAKDALRAMGIKE